MRKAVALCLIAITAAACGDNGDNQDARPGGDGPRPPDARIDASTIDADTTPDADTSMVSAQIQAALDAADGTVDLPITNATVTYLKPAIGNDPAGFTIQGAMTGPALFIAVDPSTLTPSPMVGDVVSFRITEMATAGALRQASMIADYTRTSGGVDVNALAQDLTAATDVVTALDSYASELVDVSGTIASAFSFAGSGFEQAPIDTTGISGDAAYRIRIPTVFIEALDIVPTCDFVLNNVPVGRFNANVQLPAYNASDITLSGCPAPTVVSAAATSDTTVRVTFDRNILPPSVQADGSQFTFDNGLTATAAAVDGRTVTVTTSAQTGGVAYTVTVATSVTDLQGTALGTPNTATFTGFGGGGGSTLVINEIDYDQVSSDTLEFIEVFNAGATAVSLANLAVVLVNGSGGAEYLRFNLSDAGASLPAGGYLVIRNAAVTVPGGVLTLPTGDSTIQNGPPDGVALVDTATSTVIDALSYEGAITAATITGFPGPVSLVEGAATTVVDDGTATNSMARTPNGTDTDNAAGDWALSSAPTPGAAN